jgi:heat shock protein HtpX
MKYIGLQTQIRRNNLKSIVLLIAFPALLLALVWLFFLILFESDSNQDFTQNLTFVNQEFLKTVPVVSIVITIWFIIAWFSHAAMIQRATGSKSLERKNHKRVYNLVENLCMSRGLKVPKIFIIEDNSLNAFASGLSHKTFAISLSRGIINKLNDDELEAVIAHELTHIINRDVRLLIVSIIFVGIFSFISEMAFRTVLYGGEKRNKNDKGNAFIVVILILAIIGLILSTLFRFALSRKREYLADAGAAALTKKPLALASALRKISNDPYIEAIKREDVAQMFIDHPMPKQKKSLASFFSGLFATHPPIEQRIAILEQL